MTAFNNATGQVTVASWPSGTPDADDEFVIKDRTHYKVRAVDTYGPGSFSAAQTINFTPLAAAEVGDAIISARKLIAGEVITLTAQIKDAIITNAKINDLNAGKINAGYLGVDRLEAGTVTADKLTAGTYVGGDFVVGAGGAFLVFSDVITIEADINNKLDWIEGVTTKVATLTASTTYTPTTLAAHIQTIMRAQGDADTTCVYNSTTRKITIANSTLETFTLKWSTGANADTTCGQTLGFDISADDSGALTYTADEQAALRVKMGEL